MSAFVSCPVDLTVHDLGFVKLPSGVEISKLPVWDSDAGLYARMGWRGAAAWLASRGLRLPTVEELRELDAIALQIKPYTMPTIAQLKAAGIGRKDTRKINAFRNANMSTLAWCEVHDAAVANMLSKAGHTDEPVFNAGKHWAADGVIFGWSQGGGRMIQGPSKAHATYEHTDYATTFHAVREKGAVIVPEDSDELDEVIVEIGSTAPPPDTVPGELHPEPSKPGEKGGRVAEWQRYLIGYFDRNYGVRALPSFGADGDHGQETTDWTDKWRANREIEDAPEDEEDPWSEPPVDEGLRAVNFTPANRGPEDIRLCVLHSIQCPVNARYTRSNARWFAGKATHKGVIVEPPQASIHYWVGPTDKSVLHTLEDRHVGWGAKGGNRVGVHIEQTGYTANPSRNIAQTDWLGEGLPVLERSSWIARGICERNGLPIVHLTPAEIAAGRSGICTHWGVTQAFNVPGGHYDPGGKDDRAWPIADFLEMVRAH